MSAKRSAPVQATGRGHVTRAVAEMAFRDYRRRQGDSQSLDRLLERGGFSWAELVFHPYTELLVQRAALTPASPRPAFYDLIEMEP